MQTHRTQSLNGDRSAALPQPTQQPQQAGSLSLPPSGLAARRFSFPRALVEQKSSRQYTIKSTGAIEEAFSDSNIVSGEIYCSGGVVAGVLQPAAGTTYVGKNSMFLTQVRSVGDENYPVLIEETGRSELQTAKVFVKGTAGDVLLLIYR